MDIKFTRISTIVNIYDESKAKMKDRRLKMTLDLFFVVFCVLASLLFYLLIKFNADIALIILIALLPVITNLLFYCIFNPIIKKNLENRGIPTNKKFFSHWYNQGYREKEAESFYNLLLEKGILSGDSSDLDILAEYDKLFDWLPKNWLNNYKFLVGGGTFLLFVLAGWNHFTGKLFSLAENMQGVIEAVKTEIVLLILIYIFIFGCFQLQRYAEYFFNSKERKYKNIQCLLKELQISLKKKYPKSHTL